MDLVAVLGLVRCIIGVIQATGVLLTLAQGYISGAGSASKDIEQLQKSLRDFSQFLTDLDNRVKENPQLISLTKPNSEDGPLMQCSEELESLHSSPGTGWREVSSGP